ADASLAEAMRALDARVLAVSEVVARSPRVLPPPPRTLTSLRFLGDALEKLAQAVDGADADPSSDARAGVEQAERALAPTLEAWTALRSGELDALRARLGQAGRPPVELKVKE